jgi:glycosyltransferase involved in cell wall biosynthesis
MRIGIVTQWPFPESAEHRTWKIVNTLVGAGHEVTVFTARKTRGSLAIGSQIVDVRSPWRGWAPAKPNPWRSSSPIPGNPYWAIWLSSEARRLQLDWLMSKELRLGLSTYWASRASKSKFWIDLCENYPAWVRIERGGQLLMPVYAALATLLEKRCVPAADLVSVVTESNRQRLTRLGIGETHVVVVSNTPDLQLAAARNCTPGSETLNLVYAGMLTRIRRLGLERLLNALVRIGASRKSFHLHIAGDGSEAGALRSFSESLGLGDCVQFHGRVHEFSSLFVRCDVGVIPYLLTEWAQTTIANKLFDYMASGIPVWTTSMRPCKEIIDSVNCGWVSDDSVDDMAAVLKELLSTSPEERHAKGERGRQAVLNSYNWNTDGQKMLEALASLP